MQVHHISEEDLDFVFTKIGGKRAHVNADKRFAVGGDYKLGTSLIELKLLDEEGLLKKVRQEKLADLFHSYDPESPVIVIDRRRLSAEDRPKFDRIIEGPIKSHVSKANKQLKQSLIEHADAMSSVLMIINNGYMTLDHESLIDLVVHRVKNDARNIDAVVIAGIYYHSDGFDSYFLWPINCIAINQCRPFANFDDLRAGWNELAQDFMTRLMRGTLAGSLAKGPVHDSQFEVNNVTYVRPAPVIGKSSDFYVHGRPRKNNDQAMSIPPVGSTSPSISSSDWSQLKKLAPNSFEMHTSFDAWKRSEARGRAEETIVCPFVNLPVTVESWKKWCENQGRVGSIYDFANEIFKNKILDLIVGARDVSEVKILPSSYMAVVTDIIGQDCRNDVSHIASITSRPIGGATIEKKSQI